MSETIHAEVAEGIGPHCLFVHGFLSSRAQWRLNVPALARVCRPVLVELWGHGRSPAPADPRAYSVVAYLEQFEQLRSRLGASDWFVCGQSLGACLALHYAASHPDRVRGTLFTNSMAAFLTTEQLVAGGRLDALLPALEAGGPGAREALLAMPMHMRHARRLPPALYEEIVRDSQLLEPAAVARSMRHLTPQLSVLARTGELRGPLLLANGRFESKFQPIVAQARQWLPQLEVVDLDGGHPVNAECADGFNAAAAAFIARHAAAD